MMSSRNRRILTSILTGIMLLTACTAFVFIIISLLSDNGRSAIHLNRIATAIPSKANSFIEAKGIRNTGNICFASAVAQALFRIDSTRNFVLNSSDKEVAGLKKLFTSLADPQVRVVTDHGGEFVPEQFNSGEPGDSDEFYTTWIDKIKALMGSEYLSNDFIPKVSLNRTNTNQNTSTITIDYWSAVRVNFPYGPSNVNPVDLETLFKHPNGPFGEEHLTKSLIQQYKLASFPKFLALIFVRTAYDPVKNQMIKINTPVNIPTHFNFSDYALDKVNSPEYKLKMFVIHHGDSSSGHYFVYVRDNGEDWKIIDDEVVKSVTIIDVLAAVKTSSICFYEKKAQ